MLDAVTLDQLRTFIAAAHYAPFFTQYLANILGL